jgi:hypothetical protein
MSPYLQIVSAGLVLSGCGTDKPSECSPIFDPLQSSNQIRLVLNSHNQNYSAILLCGASKPKLVAEYSDCPSFNQINYIQSNLFKSCYPEGSSGAETPSQSESAVTRTTVAPHTRTGSKTHGSESTKGRRISSTPSTRVTTSPEPIETTTSTTEEVTVATTTTEGVIETTTDSPRAPAVDRVIVRPATI